MNEEATLWNIKYWDEAANLNVKSFVFFYLLLQVFVKNTLSLQAVLGGRVCFTLLKNKENPITHAQPITWRLTVSLNADTFMRFIVWPSLSPSPSSPWFHWQLTPLAAAPPSWPAAGFWSWGCPSPALASSDSGLFVSAAPVNVKQQNPNRIRTESLLKNLMIYGKQANKKKFLFYKPKNLSEVKKNVNFFSLQL